MIIHLRYLSQVRMYIAVYSIVFTDPLNAQTCQINTVQQTRLCSDLML